MTATAASRVVLVTGVSRYLGRQVALGLAKEPAVTRVIGLDTRPATDLAGVEFVQADPHAVAPVLRDHGVDTVVHLAVATGTDAHGAGGRAAMKELNVIGTMQLLAACQQAQALRKVVVRSSTAAYGVSFRDPAVFTEETEPRDRPRGGFARDTLDIEGYVRGFHRRRPDVVATVLRLAPLLGEHATTRLARYFAQPLVPTVLGRDPRLQFVHVDDALAVLERSVTEDHPGTYNVAGPGTITLAQAVRRAGRIALPVFEPGMAALATLAGGRLDFSLDILDLFVHGRVVDTTALTKQYGFTPRSTAEAFDDFVRGIEGVAPVPAETVRRAEQAVLAGVRAVRDWVST